MQINYIILAHKNPGQLERLVNRLNGADTFFYIHFDKKIDTILFEERLKKFENVFILPKNKRANSLWGSIGIVEATLNLIEAVVADHRKGYTVLLSGQCYPLKDNNFIKNYFTEHYGENFIGGAKMPAPFWDNGGMYRIEKYYFGMSDAVSHFYALPYLFSKKYTFPYKFTFKKFIKVILRHRWNVLRLFVKRKLPVALTPYGGSAWWALPAETISFIHRYVKEHPQYLRFHRYTLLPDEIFFHTLINNHFEKVREGVHYIDWNRKNVPLPVVFKQEDFKIINASNKLYARKFDCDLDHKILDLIDERVLKNSAVNNHNEKYSHTSN